MKQISRLLQGKSKGRSIDDYGFVFQLLQIHLVDWMDDIMFGLPALGQFNCGCTVRVVLL